MKKAYIIMAHRYPEQLYRLINRLNDGHSEFFIHIDKAAEFSQFQRVTDFGSAVQFVERIESKWGSFACMQASLNGLKAVKDSGKSFEQVLLLSGQDYPIKSNEDIDAFFMASPHSIFLDFFPIPNYEKWPGSDRGGWYRVDKYFIGLQWHEFLRSRSMNLLSAYLPFLRRKMPKGMKPFTGSQWWSMDMYTVNYVLDFERAHPEYRAFHRYTFAPDELYIQMILANSTDKRIVQSLTPNNKRFMLWEKSDSPHPNTLRLSDFEAIKASDHLFARKFDATVDSEVLNRIDEEILYANRSLDCVETAA